MLVDPIAYSWQAIHGTPLPAVLERVSRKSDDPDAGHVRERERVYRRRHQANPRGARSRRVAA